MGGLDGPQWEQGWFSDWFDRNHILAGHGAVLVIGIVLGAFLHSLWMRL